MALLWRSQAQDFSSVRAALERAIAEEKLPDFVKISWDNDGLVVRIEKAGSSEFSLRIENTATGICLQENKRNVSFLHKPFVKIAEETIDNIAKRAGFQKA